MPSFLEGLGLLTRTAAGALEGHGLDKRRRIEEALEAAKEKREEKAADLMRKVQEQSLATSQQAQRLGASAAGFRPQAALRASMAKNWTPALPGIPSLPKDMPMAQAERDFDTLPTLNVQGERWVEDPTQTPAAIKKREAQEERDKIAALFTAAKAGSQDALAQLVGYDQTYLSDALRPEPKDQKQIVNGQIVNMATGTATPIQGFKADKELTPAQEQAGLARDLARESKTSADYLKNPLVKDAYTYAQGMAQALVSLENNNNAGDLGALWAIVKVFDPTSVVKEGEIKLVQSANSLPERLRLQLANWAYGRKLPPDFREKMVELMHDLKDSREKLIAPVQKSFGQRARRFQVDSAAVAPNPFEGLPERSPKNTTTGNIYDEAIAALGPDATSEAISTWVATRRAQASRRPGTP